MARKRKRPAAGSQGGDARIDLSGVPTYNLGGDAAHRHDEPFAQGALQEYERKMKGAQRRP